MFVTVAKRTRMLDKQNLTRLPNNVYPFGRGFSLEATLTLLNCSISYDGYTGKKLMYSTVCEKCGPSV